MADRYGKRGRSMGGGWAPEQWGGKWAPEQWEEWGAGARSRPPHSLRPRFVSLRWVAPARRRGRWRRAFARGDTGRQSEHDSPGDRCTCSGTMWVCSLYRGGVFCPAPVSAVCGVVWSKLRYRHISLVYDRVSMRETALEFRPRDGPRRARNTVTETGSTIVQPPCRPHLEVLIVSRLTKSHHVKKIAHRPPPPRHAYSTSSR